MYFFKEKGRQVLDMRGDLLLTHNTAPIVARIGSAAPSAVRNGQWADNITRMTCWQKLRLSLRVLRFIWGRSQELTP